MTSNLSEGITLRQKETGIFPWTLVAATVCWAVIIWIWAARFAQGPIENAAPLTVDARIVELPPSPVPSPPASIPRQKTHIKPIVKHKKPAPVHRPHRRQTPAKPVSSPTRSPASANANPMHDIMGARAIYNPLPSIPDDLRGQAISEVAVARLHIHTDGTVTVELMRPTHNPRINKIILDTLRTWMFYPAISKGMPVESVQEIKIDVSVGD
jgi:periplasmic protein TonB